MKAIRSRALVRALSIGVLAFAAHGAYAQGADIPAVELTKVTPFDFNGDLRNLPQLPSVITPIAGKWQRPVMRPLAPPGASTNMPVAPSGPTPGPRMQAPPASVSFAGMSFTDSCGGPTCGGGWPPDPNHDVGPNHIIQAVNVGYAIFDKTGTRVAAFNEDVFWSTSGANPCNGNSQGDPIALYDRLADRWVLSHFAFALDPSFNPVPPFFQCVAVSKSGDPVSGGWWLYAIQMDPGGVGLPPSGALNDYPKFGAWHDCIYMGSNEFDFSPLGSGNYIGSVFMSMSRADLYSGAPLTMSIVYLAGGPFTPMPAHNLAMPPNAPAPGTPEYFATDFNKNFQVRKFTAGRNCGAGSSLSGPTAISLGAYTFLQANLVPQSGTTTKLDMIDDRPMQRLIYRRVGTAESLWSTHTVGLSGTGPTAMQWMQLNVTGGTVNATPVQQGIHDSTDVNLWRFMGSVAVDAQGNMLLGYSTSSASTFPSIAVAGRLVGDPLNTLAQTERQVVAGGGSQNNSCGGPCDRWGDYSAMSVDPSDDCTFWYSNEYYDSQANGNSGNWHTRILSFKYPGCTGPVSGLSRSFVSATPAANDANACTLAAPCRTLARALQVTTPGGEIQILDSGGYGGLTIDRPVTIAAADGVYAGVSVGSGDGIIANPGGTGSVTLRGLTINSTGAGVRGVVLQSGTALYIENCAISNFTEGIEALPASTSSLYVRDSRLLANLTGINAGPTASGTILLEVNNSAFDRNSTAINVTQHGATGAIRNSTFTSNASGLVVAPLSGAVGTIDVRRSTFDSNGGQGVVAGNTGATVQVSIADSNLTNNGVGITAQNGGVVHVGASTIVRNSTGISFGGGGQIVSFGNNRLLDNGLNGSFSSTTGFH